MTSAERISLAIERGIHARDPRKQLDRLYADKEQLLKRGLLTILRGDDEDRERFLTEYRSICRLINENEHELRSAA